MRILPAMAVLALVLAGCAAKPAAPASPAPEAVSGETMSITGLVQNDTYAPVQGANVTLRLDNQTTTTDAGGLFEFKGLAFAPYVVDVAAPGFDNATLTAEPQANASLNFVLTKALGGLGTNQTVHFHGYLQCALEALIISPSCDSLVTAEHGPALFNDTSVLEMGTNGPWKTVVADVDFDPSASPGLDGLRMTLRGLNDQDAFGSYQQYGRFNDSKPFTVRLDPDQTYPEGTGPLPGNTTQFRFEMYPQSYLWHPGGVPVLGVGAGLNVKFELYVTVFYNRPAPQGWSFLHPTQ